ncbi:hypothetical protein AB837_00541 [bacterium AB1]|nr:hypothetical protein AB837_00541 [bacterium AB1]
MVSEIDYYSKAYKYTVETMKKIQTERQIHEQEEIESKQVEEIIALINRKYQEKMQKTKQELKDAIAFKEVFVTKIDDIKIEDIITDEEERQKVLTTPLMDILNMLNNNNVLSCHKEEKILKKECNFYRMFLNLPEDKLYYEYSMPMRGFNLFFNKYMATYKIILQKLNIPKELMLELKELSRQRNELCQSCFLISNNEAWGLFVCHSEEDKEKYDNINESINHLIYEKYLKDSKFNLENFSLIKRFIQSYLFHDDVKYIATQ